MTMGQMRERYEDEIKEWVDMFKYEHLPKHLQEVSKPFCELAHNMAKKLPSSHVVEGLKSLMHAKDSFCRASLIGATRD